MAGPERRETAYEGLLSQRAADVTNHHIARFAACRPLGRLAGPVGVMQCRPCFDQKRIAGLGERDATVCAQKKLHAKLVLQRTNVLTQRRLGNAQALGCTTDMQFFGGGNKVAELAEVHYRFSI